MQGVGRLDITAHATPCLPSIELTEELQLWASAMQLAGGPHHNEHCNCAYVKKETNHAANRGSEGYQSGGYNHLNETVLGWHNF